MRPAGDRLTFGRLLSEQLAAAGFDYKVAARLQPEPRPWPRPPLFTDLELAGVPLQGELGIRTKHSSDALVDIYERFIAGFFYSQVERRCGRGKLLASRYLERELRLGRYPARMLFPGSSPKPGRQRLEQHLNLVQFAALVAYNHRCHIEHGPDTFVATTVPNARQFGVRGGKLVSNLPRERREIPVRFLDNPGGRLVDIARGEPIDMAPSPYDVMRDWLEGQGRLGQLQEAMLLAVSILRWSRPLRETPAGLLRLFGYEYSSDALHEVCAHAREFEQFSDPYRTLKEMFAPFIAKSDFVDLFGARPKVMPVPAGVRTKWVQAINSLDPMQAQ